MPTPAERRSPDWPTPTPYYVTGTVRDTGIHPLVQGWGANDGLRVQAAARQARLRYPGAVGEFLARDMETYATFGYLLGSQTLVRRLVDELLGPLPSEAA